MDKCLTIPGLPSPEVYELEYQFWPWKQMIMRVEDWVVENAPKSGCVVDYMCGCGYLLNGISKRRPDLHLHGNSFDIKWIAYGRSQYPSIDIKYAHSLKYQPPEPVDIAIITGAIHHLTHKEQPQFMKRVWAAMKHNGFCIIGEEVLPRYSNIDERRLGVLRLGNLLLSHVIKQQAPDVVLEAAVDLLKRDLFCFGEYKIALPDLKTMIEINFLIDQCSAIWPVPEIGFGDYLLVCRPKYQEPITNEL